ncbi:S1C family serine protease [Solicola sp. PLA-1-18]|uniref:S1C family serine protease n=1 Tax=Solicola sp. PLA-1-18 TaxID=3380532 RepID=UPI003B75F8EC
MTQNPPPDPGQHPHDPFARPSQGDDGRGGGPQGPGQQHPYGQQPAHGGYPQQAAPSSQPLGYPGQDARTSEQPYATPNAYTHRYSTPGAQGPEQTRPFLRGELQGGQAVAAPRRRRTGLVVAAALVAGLVGGVGGAAGYGAINGDGSDSGVISSLNPSSSNETRQVAAGDVEAVASKVLPSTVQINVRGESSGEESGGSGTGIIISSNGDILTNNHVVEAAAEGGSVTVSFNDGKTAKADIVGRDPVTDLAVIKAEGQSGLTAASLGNSKDLKVGQEVVAIGSPFGLESTVTSGIVSALNRPVSSSDGSGNSTSVFPAVQTDAAINPGNSGGPLVDMAGNVVGVNSAIRSNSGGSGEQAGSIGLGFSIPIDLAKNVADQLVQGKTVEHARLGVTVGNALQADGLTSVGAEVKEVTSGGAGADAGLKSGDVITALNGQAIGSSDALVATIRGFQPGDKVEITYRRGNATDKTQVTLASDGGQLGS